MQVRKVRAENIAKKKELNEVQKDVKGEERGQAEHGEGEGNSPQSCVQVVARPAAAARARVR